MAFSIVTGANRGIGLALTQALLSRGEDVLAVCRSSSAALDKSGAEVLAGVDVTDPASIDKLVQGVGDRKVDLLINNAGILVWGDSMDSPNFEGMSQQFEVNAMGPLRVTFALQNQIADGGKLAFITSRMGSVADNGSGGAYGYRMSKAALNIGAKSVAQDMKNKNVAVVILHPGMVKTDMIGGKGQVEPEEAAAGLLTRIDELTLENTGKFFHQNGEELPW